MISVRSRSSQILYRPSGLWFLALKSVVQATLAEVALAFVLPIGAHADNYDRSLSPFHRLEHAIEP
ncbi:MAG: hypothetical protein EXR09_07015 [Acetobacteraceae bacterium]|nr:hypothetical protein [Acetobacteraceae bacterium]